MKYFNRIAAGLLLCLLWIPAAGQSSPSLLQEALTLNEIRHSYAAFCESIGITEAQLLVPNPDTDPADLHPHLRTCMNNILAEGNTGVSPSSTNRNIFGSGFDQPIPLPGATPAPAATSDSVADRRRFRQIIKEWHHIEAFVMGPDKMVADSGMLDLSNPSLATQFPSGFKYLDEINKQVQGISGINASQTSGRDAGVLSAITGGMPEAQIIQGIVDWTIRRAKEELLQAFLQKWLDEMEQNPVLQAAFPNTLDLLATTDLSTIFSQGDTWKAAFQQDLDAIPNHLPRIVQLILEDLPRKLNPEIEREIVGGINVASQLYVQLDRNQNNLQDAVTLISQSLMRQPDTLAYSERAVVAAEVLQNAVMSVKNGLPAVITPKVILDLGATQLCDFWNLIYLRDKAELTRIFELEHPDSLYIKVARELDQVQLILARTADIMQNIHDILDISKSGGSMISTISNSTSKTDASRTGSIGFQKARAYYELVQELLNNSLDLATLLQEPTGDLKQVLNNVVGPMGEDVMDIAEGVATQQYGAVISSSISLLRLISDQLVRDPEVRYTLNQATALLEAVQDFRTAMNNASGSGSQLKKEAGDVVSIWLENNRSRLDSNLQTIASQSLAAINAYQESDLSAVKSFLKKELRKLEKELITYIDDQDLGEGIDRLADFFNTYGTLMVNILTASSSDEVEQAIEAAATPTGSYMVKQASRSSLTLTFFPGAAAGYEFPSASRDIFASGGDTLGYGSAGYLGATLPIGLEFAFGIKSRVLGAVGVFGQVADLGAVLNFRLRNPGDSVAISNDITFKKVLSPGFGVALHAARIPIVLGGRVSYTPELRTITDGNASYQLNTLQIGAFLAVDVTVLQLFASRKKIPTEFRTYRER